MSLSQMLLPELDLEMTKTRTCLTRIPDDKLDWQPHEKSMTLGRLASHLIETVAWMTQTLKTDSLDLSPPGGEPWTPLNLGSQEEMLKAFDAHVPEARQALIETDDAAFAQDWSLLRGGETLLTMPRIALIRSMVLNHLIHHRGQLTVYFRLNGIPVPAIYGPSADEGEM